jgi:hypothetical protein
MDDDRDDRDTTQAGCGATLEAHPTRGEELRSSAAVGVLEAANRSRPVIPHGGPYRNLNITDLKQKTRGEEPAKILGLCPTQAYPSRCQTPLLLHPSSALRAKLGVTPLNKKNLGTKGKSGKSPCLDPLLRLPRYPTIHLHRPFLLHLILHQRRTSHRGPARRARMFGGGRPYYVAVAMCERTIRLWIRRKTADRQWPVRIWAATRAGSARQYSITIIYLFKDFENH